MKYCTCKDEALLLYIDALFLLHLFLHEFDRVVRLEIEGDLLPREALDVDPHTVTDYNHQRNRWGNTRKF